MLAEVFVGGRPQTDANSHPLQCAFLPDPDVTHDQDAKKDQHFEQPKKAKGFELYSPWEKENGLHVEDHKQDGNNIVANRITASSPVDWINTALVGQKLLTVRIAW